MKSIVTLFMVLFLITSVSACSTPPYVYKSGEFNRSSVQFAKEPDDISTVIVCYSSYSGTPQDIMKLALDRCAEYGKKAVYESQSYLNCPLATPVAAHYICEAPEKKNLLYDGYNFQY